MKFFLPNFEDVVDPEFDFLNDKPSSNRKNRREHDKFAHEFFQEPIFDGMLISKASLSTETEKYIQKLGGAHKYTRLDESYPILGDCGAFTYFLEKEPIYSIEKILEYYNDLKFDYGVSLDHLAFVTVDLLNNAFTQGKIKTKWWENLTTEKIQEERYQLTLKNSKIFLELHNKHKFKFQPVGIAQGTSPDHYYSAIDALIKMGYQFLALGGLARSKDEEIVNILKKIKPLIKNGINLHIFGVARLSLLKDFIELGVTSADSAAPLRRAFLGTGEDNYWTNENVKYSAIRIPDANGKSNKRGLNSVNTILENNGELTSDILVKLEQEALNALRLYDKGDRSIGETLDILLTYDKLYGDKRDHAEAYLRVLTDKPWNKCNCTICRKIGVEVIIFRGNNRNRRRGFHNVKNFYDMFKEQRTFILTDNHNNLKPSV